MLEMRSAGVFRRKAAPLLERSPSKAGRAYNGIAISAIVIKHRIPLVRRLAIPILLSGHRPFWVSDRSELLVLKDVFVDGSYDELALPQEAQTILDLGANAGLASRFFRSRYPAALIIAYEPSASTAALARRNMTGDLRFDLNVAAVAGATGIVSLRENPGDSWSTSISTPGDGRDVVRAESLDSVVRRHAPIDILKIDIEGSEYEAFESCRVLHEVNLIVGEIHASEERSPEDFLALLSGFEVLRWDIVDGTGPFVARRLQPKR
jgi:FkbM family methyltransferase